MFMWMTLALFIVIHCADGERWLCCLSVVIFRREWAANVDRVVWCVTLRQLAQLHRWWRSHNHLPTTSSRCKSLYAVIIYMFYYFLTFCALTLLLGCPAFKNALISSKNSLEDPSGPLASSSEHRKWLRKICVWCSKGSSETNKWKALTCESCVGESS